MRSSTRTKRRPGASGSLLGEGVPETNPNVVIVGPSRVVLISRIDAAKKVCRKVCAWWQERSLDLNAWSELDRVRPVLSLRILGEIRVHQNLDCRTLPNMERAACAMLRVKEPVLIEPAHVDRVRCRFVEQTNASATQ